MIFNLENIHSSLEELYFKSGGAFSKQNETALLITKEDTPKNWIKSFVNENGVSGVIFNSGNSLPPVTLLSGKNINSLLIFCIGGNVFHGIKNKSYQLGANSVSFIPFNDEKKHYFQLSGEECGLFGVLSFPNGFFENRSNFWQKNIEEFKRFIYSELGPVLPNQVNLIEDHILSKKFFRRSASFAKKFNNEWVMKVINLQSVKKSENDIKEISILFRDYDFEQLEYVKDLIVKDYLNPPTLKKVSRLAGINEYKLKYAFKQVFGITINGYIRKIRMEKAKQLIEENYDTGIYEIAEKVGYTNKGHFAQRFKEVVGLLPKDYQKMIREEKILV